MKLLILTELFYPHGGGAELATYEYAKLLSSHGIEVRVITNLFPSELTIEKINNFLIYRLPLLSTGGSQKYQILTDFNIYLSSTFRKSLAWADIVYVPRYWFYAIPIAKLHHKPVIVHFHDFIAICPLAVKYNFSKQSPCDSSCSPKCIYAFEKEANKRLPSIFTSCLLNSTIGCQLHRLIDHCDAAICVSQNQANIIAKELPTMTNKIHVIYNPQQEHVPTRIVSTGFGFFGGSTPIKGFSVLKNALSKLNALPLSVFATNFPSLPLENSFSARIEYYGRLNKDELNLHYRNLQTVVFPSICPEPSPYLEYESILKARLVIASDIGGAPEIAEGCKGLFTFTTNDSEQLAQKIQHVHQFTIEQANDLALQSSELLLRKLDNDATLRKFVNCCQQLIKN